MIITDANDDDVFLFFLVLHCLDELIAQDIDPAAVIYSSLLSCPYYYYRRRRRTSPAPSQLQECFQVQRRRCLRLACWWCSWPLGAFQPDGPKPTTDANSPAIYSTNTNCRPIKSLSVRTLSLIFHKTLKALLLFARWFLSIYNVKEIAGG